MPVAPDTRLDAADLNVRGIPLGELVSFPPRHVALLAMTGDLPSASAQRAFDARLFEGAGPMRKLAAALDELDACEREIATQAAHGLSSFVAELIHCFFAMTVATASVDSGPGGLDAAGEMVDVAAWIDGWAKEPPTRPVRVPGFGHPRLHGLDPRFVAIHAIVVRCCASDARVGAMQRALRWAPQMLAQVPIEHEHEHEHEHDGRRTIVLANMYLPMGVGLMAGGVAPREYAGRLVRAPASVQAAIDATLRDR